MEAKILLSQELKPAHRIQIVTMVVMGLACTPGIVGGANQVIAWGNSTTSTNRVLGEFDGVVQMSAGVSINLGLKTDGSVLGRLVYNNSSLTLPSDATNVLSIAASGLWYERAGYSLALRRDGTVASLGFHSLWTPSARDYNVPVPPGLSNIIAIAPGLDHALALQKTGAVVAWGGNSSGERQVPANATNVVAIAAGDYYSLALRADGTVIAWGGYYSAMTNLPAGLSNVVAIAAGYHRAAALRADGTMVAWGINPVGETNSPNALSNIIAIAAGEAYGLALRSNGTVTGWGYNNYHNLDIPAGLTNVTGISAGSYSLALIGDGPPFLTTSLPNLVANYGTTVRMRIEATGAYPLNYQWKFDGTDLPGATNAVLEMQEVKHTQAGRYSVSVGNRHGSTTSSEMTLTVVPLFIRVQPRNQSTYRGASATFSVGASGEPPICYQWQFNGIDLTERTNRSLELTNLQYAQAGVYSVIVSNPFAVLLASKATLQVGQVAAWGDNESGQTNLPPGLTNLIAISAGGLHSLGLSADGRVLSWGDVLHGQTNWPSGLADVVSIAAGGFHSLALKRDGTLAAWGDNSYGQADPPPLADVVAVAAGLHHSLALRADGTVVAWGRNFNGQTNVPPDLTNAVMISAGVYHNLVLKDNGTIVAWGGNSNGQTNLPVGLAGVVAIAAGGTHSCALTFDGMVIAWGNDSSGQTRVPSGLARPVQISAGASHSLVLTAEDAVTAWGNNISGQTNVPSDLSDTLAIAAGGSHSLALLEETPRQSAAILNPNWTGNSFNVTLATRSGKVYRLEHKSLLTDPTWIPLPLVAGNGRLLKLTDPSANGSARFYRIREW